MPSLGHVLIEETPQMYLECTKPYIQTVEDSGSLSWIKNLVEVKKEKERLLVNHDDFIINIDTKWRSHPPPLTTPREEWMNHPSTVDLYCLGICKQSDITCLRDLRREHIPLLKAMMKEGLTAIKSIYGVEQDQIRVFIHYQPQFYHFHIHFTRLENEVGCSVERGHLVSDVIQNLLQDDYYKNRTITYKLQKGSPLQNIIGAYLEEHKD
jgi:m7GpppX diphosphatase